MSSTSVASTRRCRLWSGVIAIVLIGSVNLLMKRSTKQNDNSQPEALSELSELSELSASNSKKGKKGKKGKVTKVNKISKYQFLPSCSSNSKDWNETARWSERPFPSSSAKSLFNCDLPDAICKYYYPSNFFDKECGLAKEFVHHVEDMEAKRLNGTLWNFMPSVGFPTLTMQNACLDARGNKIAGNGKMKRSNLDGLTLTDIGEHVDPDTQHRCMTERLSFLHVHKSGGSSLHQGFNYMASNSGTSLTRHKFFTPSRKPGVATPEDKIYNSALESLSHATKYPAQHFKPHQHTIFALVRDPTDRFISSIGQATGAVGSQSNHIGPILKEACIKSTSRETLNCIAKYVRDHGFWIELHFTPQVIDISFTTLFKDVPIGIIPFKQIKTVLSYFGKGSVQLRNGKSEHYRSDEVLKNMTVADYDDETLKIVCEIYEMDVIMQRSLGIQVPKCDPYIPNDYYEFD